MSRAGLMGFQGGTFSSILTLYIEVPPISIDVFDFVAKNYSLKLRNSSYFSFLFHFWYQKMSGTGSLGCRGIFKYFVTIFDMLYRDDATFNCILWFFRKTFHIKLWHWSYLSTLFYFWNIKILGIGSMAFQMRGGGWS